MTTNGVTPTGEQIGEATENDQLGPLAHLLDKIVNAAMMHARSRASDVTGLLHRYASFLAFCLAVVFPMQTGTLTAA
jgi:hypothetical protein